MTNSILLKSEELVRQVAFKACPEWWDSCTCDVYATSQLVNNTTESLSQAIFTIYEYSSDVLYQHNADYETLQPVWNLAEEVSECDSIFAAQRIVEKWIETQTEWC